MTEKILCIGLTCLDMVQTVKDYPKEDSDQRSIGVRWQRGGNASNNCTILSQLGIDCHFMGTIGQDLTVKFMEEDFSNLNINIEKCQFISGVKSPISTVILNSRNGSRTIIHDPGNLPELSKEHFQKLDFKQYKWIHFEGRNTKVIVDILNQIQYMDSERPHTSVELEKPLRELDVLIPLADFVFLSKEYAESRGWNSAEQAVTQAAQQVRNGATVICAWGVQGAWAKCVGTREDQLFHSSAYPPAQVVDTLGAGDTFVAGILASQLHNFALQKSLEFACRLAGAKVGQNGLKGFLNAWKEALIIGVNPSSDL